MELVEPIAINTKIKSKKDLKESLQILQTWFSPSFPVGSFSYSHGLEAMINDNFIKSKEDILDYLKCILKYGTGKNDVILMKYTYQGKELNELALSLCPSKERKIESIEIELVRLTPLPDRCISLKLYHFYPFHILRYILNNLEYLLLT